jgi:ferredoxin-NADP reductase
METSERAHEPRWKANLARAAKHLFLDRKLEHWLGELDATRSLTALRARVVQVIDETADVKTFVVHTNAHWQGHRAGQFTTVEVEIDGRRVRRCYSLSSASSAPGAATVAFTVKRVPGGQVSPWLHANLRAGSIVGLSPAAGAFVLPAPASASPAPPSSAKLCFLSGGSGITPTMAILRDLAARNDAQGAGDVVFIHHARSAADVPFRRTLEAFAARHPGLRLVIRTDDAPDGEGVFSEARLAQLVPDLAERLTFLCGPAGLMARVERHFASLELAGRLISERFVIPGAAPPSDAEAQIVKLRLATSGRSFAASSTGTLLEQLERHGERPAHGCRIGICHTCKCRKVAGTVQNLITGELSSTPQEDIQLCISVPRSDVELGL